MIRFLVSLLTTLMGAAFMACLCIFLVLSYYGRGLPDYKQLEVYEPAIVTRFYAGDGRLFQEYALQKRVFIPITAIPPLVRYGFLAAEDKNFYQHPGIDFWSLARAFFTNIVHLAQRRRPIGASTITQQVARNFLLSDELSLERKIKEAILAFRIDHAFDKDHILELYLNEIYLGAGAYGVGAAALHYFNKSLDDLSLSEIAYLAALPKAPNNYNPQRFPQRALGRRNWVLQRMMEDGIISPEQGLAAMKEPIVLHTQDKSRSVRADHFAEELRRDLLHRYGEEVLYKGGLVVHTTLDPHLQEIAERTLRQGLVTYDRRHGWRGPIAHIPPEGLKASPSSSGPETSGLSPQKDLPQWALALSKIPIPSALEPWHMAVVLSLTPTHAKIGLANGKEGTIPLGEMKWARRFITCDSQGPAVQKPADVVQVGDVIGVAPLNGEASTHTEGKAQFTLCQIPQVNGALVAMDPHTGRVLALSGGYSYATSEFNRATQALRQPGSSFKTFVCLTALEEGFAPNTIVEDGPIAINMGYGLGIWKPENITKKFYGPRTLRYGLEHSLNLLTIRLGQMVGMEKVSATAARFGVMNNMPPHLSMCLGAGETTLLRLTTAHGMMVNGGKKIVPTLVDRIQDRLGRTVFKHDHRKINGVEPQILTEFPTLIDNREQVTDPISAYQIVSMLEGTVQRGTARVAQKVGKPVAAKTGSTDDCKDTWCLGFSPDLAVGVYVGFDTPKSLGKMDTGGRVAAPIFANFMEEALQKSPPIPFRIPPGVQLVSVDLDTGLPTTSDAPNSVLEALRPNLEGEGPPLPLAEMTDMSQEAISTSSLQQGQPTPPHPSPGGAAPLFY
jgi:penicillin-binding protein 1A